MLLVQVLKERDAVAYLCGHLHDTFGIRVQRLHEKPGVCVARKQRCLLTPAVAIAGRQGVKVWNLHFVCSPPPPPPRPLLCVACFARAGAWAVAGGSACWCIV